MVIDQLSNAAQYYHLGDGIHQALQFLEGRTWEQMENGKYEIDGQNVVAIIQEYDTKDPLTEQLESHRKYIDVQYVVSGKERMGHALLNGQTPTTVYDPETDFLLYKEAPSFFSLITPDMFTIFYPTDLHMPCIMVDAPEHVRKIVIKVAVTAL